MALSMLGKFETAGGFGIIFLYTAELFPTGARAFCIGVCATVGRVGAIVAPFASYLVSIYFTLLCTMQIVFCDKFYAIIINI